MKCYNYENLYLNINNKIHIYLGDFFLILNIFEVKIIIRKEIDLHLGSNQYKQYFKRKRKEINTLLKQINYDDLIPSPFSFLQVQNQKL